MHVVQTPGGLYWSRSTDRIYCNGRQQVNRRGRARARRRGADVTYQTFGRISIAERAPPAEPELTGLRSTHVPSIAAWGYFDGFGKAVVICSSPTPSAACASLFSSASGPVMWIVRCTCVIFAPGCSAAAGEEDSSS